MSGSLVERLSPGRSSAGRWMDHFKPFAQRFSEWFQTAPGPKKKSKNRPEEAPMLRVIYKFVFDTNFSKAMLYLVAGHLLRGGHKGLHPRALPPG